MITARDHKYLIGKKFGRLTIISCYTGKLSNLTAKCECECGTQRDVYVQSLKTGHTKSCGCLPRELSRVRGTKHGGAGSRLYMIWNNMKDRCSNPNNNYYHNYGGRGINFTGEWFWFAPFQEWALSNGYNDALTLDRVDNNKDYSPDNCKWSTRHEQMRNTRRTINVTYENETKCLKDWAAHFKIKYATVRCRIKKGYTPIDALTTPLLNKNGHNPR